MALLIPARAARAFIACALVALGMPTRAEIAMEHDLKSAFAYNFMVLSTWPVDPAPPLRFCVAGVPVATTAFKVLEGKQVRERNIVVTGVPTPDRAGECNVLYVPPGENERLDAWLASVSRRAVLTISDQARGRGAIVNLRSAEGRVVFDVDTRAAQSARIGLSSQLIKLAATRQ